MNDMKDFRKLADEAMSDIFVTDEMKDKVISKCKGKSRVPAGRIVALAACGVLILGGLELSGVLRLQNRQEGGQDSQMNIFSATNTAAPGVASNPNPSGTGPAKESGSGTGNQPGTVAEWQPADLEEAGASFGPEFLTPEYTPEGYKLGQITAAGANTKAAEKIVMTYTSGKQTFLIIEQKESSTEDTRDFDKGYRKVKIGGIDGYVKTASAGSTTPGSADTEIHWFKNDVHYSVTGDLKQEDALMTAELMLPLGK